MVFVDWNRIGREQNIAEIVLNRPEARNAFNSEMAEQILEICQTIDRSDVESRFDYLL